MTQTVPIKEAAARLEELVSNLSPGDEIQLTSQDLPVARIVAQTVPRRRGGSCKGMIIENPSVPDDIHLQDFKDYME